MSELPAWIRDIRARANATTRGPWEAQLTPKTRHPYTLTYEGGRYLLVSKTGVAIASSLTATGRDKRDFDFIAHAYADVPRLLDLVEQMAGVLERVMPGDCFGGEARFSDYCTKCELRDGCDRHDVLRVLDEYRGEEESDD